MAEKMSRHIMHLSLAEHGKICLVRGDVTEALRHFREAIRLSVSSGAPEVFFRYYTQCVLEALERSGAYEDVLEYCRQADAHFETIEVSSAFLRKDHGTTIERLALMLLLLDRRDEAREALARAISVAGKGVLPLAESVHGWLVRGMVVTPDRLRQQQERHSYFTVTAQQLRPELARALPHDSRTPATAFAPA